MSYAYYNDLLKLGNEASPVAIVTLWTVCDQVIRDVNPELFKTAGQLYTKNGLNYLVRNLLADKSIRYLVLCGQDRSGSGEEIFNLWKNKHSEHLHKEINSASLASLINQVKLINLIGVEDGQIIEREIKRLDMNIGAYGQPEYFPEPEIKTVSELECSWPSDTSVFKVSGRTAAETWLKVLRTVLRFGDIKLTDAMKMKEACNLAAVITDEDADNFFIPDWTGLDKDKVSKYLPQIVSGEKNSGLYYTYGNRLQEHFKVNQLERIISRLNNDPNAREAVGMLFDPNIDFDAEHRPCLVLIQALKNHGRLHLTAYVRSHDIFGGWLLNAFGLRKLQKIISDRTGIAIGPLTVISASAHIYDFNWTSALEIVHSNLKNEFEPDPRGFYKIEIDKIKKRIKVERFAPDGLLLETFSSGSAQELWEKIDGNLGVSLVSHAAYLGLKLAKAEMAIKLGIDYVQDHEL